MELPLLLQIPSLSVMSRNEPPGFENCSARSAQLQFAVLTFFCLPLPWVPQGWGKTRMSQQEISASPLTVPWEIGCLTGWNGVMKQFHGHLVASILCSLHTHVLQQCTYVPPFWFVFPWGVLSCFKSGEFKILFLAAVGMPSAGVPGFDLRRPNLCHTSWRTRFAFRRMAQDATIVQTRAEP